MMVAKFILIAIYASGYGPRAYPIALGEYSSAAACQRASVAVYKTFEEFGNTGGVSGFYKPKMVCVAKD